MSVQGAPAAGQAKPRVTVSRYSVFTRLNHWTLATCFVLLALTGLSLFHPSLFWIAGLFGGGAVVRWLHPWIGVVLIVAWLVMFVRFFRANLPERGDGEWLARSRDVLSGHEENLPEVGKYNAGQKLVFWTFSLLVPGLFLTGIAIWDQYFYGWTTILQKRAAVLAHALFAIGMITVWIVHAYAAVWVRGTIQGMTRGYVTGGWAWRHHRKWLRELVVGRRKNVTPGSPAE
jgi:formate dehydrogenase subunit gamma